MGHPDKKTFSVRFWMKALTAMIVFLLLLVWEHVQASHMERQLKSMRKEADRLTYENARLQTQINQWVSPSHLDKVAKQELGMIPLDSEHVIGLQRL